MTSQKRYIPDFQIPDNDPPLAILVDEYIERYGK